MALKASAYAAHSFNTPLVPFTFDLPTLTADDVHIKIMYCGMCHSDISVARNEWGGSKFPVVPGHEIVGKVLSLGKEVSKFAINDIVAVGCFVDSCRNCEYCHKNCEQYCQNGVTQTYNSSSRRDGTITRGGYSSDIIVAQRFVVKVPDGMDLTRVAPLLCAGATVYHPMVFHDMLRPNVKIGVVGLGGLGHMAVKFGVAAGCKVTVISTSEGKRETAIKSLGAHEFLNSSNEEELKKATKSFDFIIDTINIPRSIDPLLLALKTDGVIVFVGITPYGTQLSFTPALTIVSRLKIAGSLVLGLKGTQEMLDYCGKHQILSDVEVVKPEYINQAIDRMMKNDVKFRFVIDFTS